MSHGLSGPVSRGIPISRDTARLCLRYPPIARYGVFGDSTWPVGCDTPSLFMSVSPLESMRGGCAIRPPQKGYLSDTCAIAYENKAKRMRYTPLRYDHERVLRDMGGVSRIGPLRS